MANTQAVDYAWSNPSTYSEGTGVHHGYSTAKADRYELSDHLSGFEVSNFEMAKAWYAKLDSGGFIVPHVDQGPWVERWHYPISGRGAVWQDWEVGGLSYVLNAYTDPDAGPYRMNHHKPHAVWNPHDEARIILIVEYDNPIDQPSTDLLLCDMIPEVQTMIDNI